MFIKLDELKSLITTTAPDPVLLMYITYVENMIIDYCKNNFINAGIKYNSSELIFSDSENTISDSSAEFVIKGFRAEDIIFITGSLLNNRYMEIVSLTETVITVTSVSKLKSENSGNSITVYKVELPESVKLAVAAWIDILLNPDKEAAKSIKIGRFSESKESKVNYETNRGSIPPQVKALLPKPKVKYF